MHLLDTSTMILTGKVRDTQARQRGAILPETLIKVAGQSVRWITADSLSMIIICLIDGRQGAVGVVYQIH